MQITSELENIRVASAEIINYIKEKKGDHINKDTLFDIKLSVEEAVRNAIVHGNKADKNLTIDIEYKIEKDILKVTIEDRGDGFDLSKLPDPTNPENLFKESGRGVYIIHRLMDKAVYNKKGNSLTMEKILK